MNLVREEIRQLLATNLTFNEAQLFWGFWDSHFDSAEFVGHCVIDEMRYEMELFFHD